MQKLVFATVFLALLGHIDAKNIARQIDTGTVVMRRLLDEKGLNLIRYH